MTRTQFLLLASLIMLSASGVASATTYKCTDATGNTQYTAVPPKDADCQPLTVRGNAPSKPKAKQPAQTQPVKNAENHGVRPTNDADISRINKENCDRARANLKLLTSSTRIRLKKDGEYRVIPEEERQEKIRLAQEQADTYCK